MPSISGSTPTSASLGSFSSMVKLYSLKNWKSRWKYSAGKRLSGSSVSSRSKSPPLRYGMSRHSWRRFLSHPYSVNRASRSSGLVLRTPKNNGSRTESK